MRQIGAGTATPPRLAAVPARTLETFPLWQANAGGFDDAVQTWEFAVVAPLIFDQFTLAPAEMAGRPVEFLVDGVVLGAGQLGAGAVLTLATPVEVAAGKTLTVRLTRPAGANPVYVSQSDNFRRGAAVAGGALTFLFASANNYAPAMRFTLGADLPKGVHGPLDASDFPVVTSLDQLVAGQVGLLDNGTDPPRLVRKRLDGSVPPLRDAISTWPVCVANMDTDDAPGTPPVQVIPYAAFTRLNLSGAPIDTHGGFSAGTHAWTVPPGQGGLYHIEMKLRFTDGTPPSLGFGLGADIVERDSTGFRWANTITSRQGELNQRDMQLAAGQQVVMFAYWEGNADWRSGPIKSAELSIVRIR